MRLTVSRFLALSAPYGVEGRNRPRSLGMALPFGLLDAVFSHDHATSASVDGITGIARG